MLKVRLRWWNKEIYGWVDLHLEKAFWDLNLIKDKWTKGGGFNYLEDLEKRKSLSNSFWSLLLRRESILS